MNHIFFSCTHQADQSSEVSEPQKVTSEGRVIALSAPCNCQVLAFIPSSCCLQRDTLPLAWYLSRFFRSDVELEQSCSWLNWASSSLWSEGNYRLCMLEYFFYCISQTSAACELAYTKQLLVCCTGAQQLLSTCQFFLILTALPPEATKNTAELRRKVPQTHLYVYILCCCGQAAIITYSALQNSQESDSKHSQEQGKGKLPSDCPPSGFAAHFLLYFSNNFTVALKSSVLFSRSINQQFTC